MKYLSLALSCLFILSSCKGNKTSEKASLPTISSHSVSETLNFLASDQLEGRNTGTQGIDEAATYVEDIFKKSGLKPYFETYRDNFDAKGVEGFNIVGLLEGNDPQLKNEYIVLGAHYDHIGYGKVVENDSIANGANDNASGTTVIIQLAKYLAAKKNNKRSILFTLFSAEEMGLLGSDHLAQKLKNDDLNLYTMVNFEMLGVPFKDRDYEVFLTGFERSNMAEIMNGYAKENLVGFSEVSKKYSLFMRSDNYAFYKQFNLPCHTISSCDLTNFDFYHHVDDEVDKLNTEFMANVINKMIPIIEGLSNSPTKEVVLYEE